MKAHSMFTFDVCWGSLGTSIFGNSSPVANNTRSRLPSRLSFRFLWLWFNYAPLIWMFANKSSIDKILKIHKRILQIVYGVYVESYENLLNRSDDISLHQKHLRYLAIEVYKSLTKLNPGFIWNFFERNHIPYNLRRGDLLLLPPAKSTRYGVNSLAFQGSLLWNNLPSQVKESQTLDEFKNKIKNLRSIHCTCTLCRWRRMPFYFNL